MTYAKMHNVGGELSVTRLILPQENDGTAINSTTIYADRCPAGSKKEYMSAVFYAAIGAATGSPNAQSFPFILQTSDATGSGWASYTDPSTGSVPTITLTADNTEGYVNVDLSNAKRYLRCSLDATFTSGSSPENEVCSVIIMGGTTDSLA